MRRAESVSCCQYYVCIYIAIYCFDCWFRMQMVAQQQADDAVRCVKFSADPVGLLAYAEHESAVHIVDARRYGARQVLAAAPTGVGISGLAFTPEVRGCKCY